MKPFSLVIFGITSNLAQIKLIPALYDLEEKALLPKRAKILGIARKSWSKKELNDYLNQVLHLENIHHQHSIKRAVFRKLCQRFEYLAGDLSDQTFYPKLREYIEGDKIFYLATYPELYRSVFNGLKSVHLNKQNGGYVRLIIEKPIGNNLTSARNLNKLLTKYFLEEQIFRLDHYLGKETLQNILSFRFGNGIFEPLINKDSIDHIQLSALEHFGIGKRGGYYDSIGALKDVGQNHLLQMLAATCMDAPAEFSNQALTKQRIKILQSLIPFPDKVVFGQYQGYTKEERVDPRSLTDTYFALKTQIKSDRFKGVPIYIRAGKSLSQTVTEISIVFKNPINRLFGHLRLGRQPNVLVFRIQPNEGVVVKIVTKKVGHEVELEPNYLQFCYRYNPSSHYLPDAYERLLFDAIRGDQTFFNDAQEVEAEWAFIEPLSKTSKKPYLYKVGSWGPKQADRLIRADGRAWLEPSMEFCPI